MFELNCKQTLQDFDASNEFVHLRDHLTGMFSKQKNAENNLQNNHFVRKIKWKICFVNFTLSFLNC